MACKRIEDHLGSPPNVVVGSPPNVVVSLGVKYKSILVLYILLNVFYLQYPNVLRIPNYIHSNYFARLGLPKPSLRMPHSALGYVTYSILLLSSYIGSAQA